MAARFAVEAWSPEYGSAFEIDDANGDDPNVDLDVECTADTWEPIRPEYAPVVSVAFVDGVRRVDARIWADHQDTPRLGICASYAAGVVHGNGGKLTLSRCTVERSVFANSEVGDIATALGTYGRRAVASDAIEQLFNALQVRLGEIEITAAKAAPEAELVVVDGTLSGRHGIPGAIGYIKSHHVRYLPARQAAVVGALRPGERTPLFLTSTTWSRYSWYLRLPGGRGHPWAGIVRCEAAATLSPGEARAVADRATASLPRFASQAHKEPRAPQNLYPVSGLERALRRRLGDQQLLYRALCRAAADG